MEAAPPVLVAREGGALVLTLNRPKALNALTLDMIEIIRPALLAAANDTAIRLVIIEGAGERAFCAGGDVKAVALALDDPSSTLPADFFREEYRLNQLIHRFPKPFVALIQGVSMGGGVGLSVHGSHRVVTETLTFAMPETGIGLFPDVGATWFLSRRPGALGTFLALTGARLGAGDAHAVGYATHVVPSTRLAQLREQLIDAAPTTSAEIDHVLAPYAIDAAAPLAGHRALIDAAFSAGSVEAIRDHLLASGDEWAGEQARILATKSPLSLKITHEALARARSLAIEACFTMEYRLSQACMAAPDFREGIRALLIDKDQNPRWRPDRLEAVDRATIEACFAPLGPHDLVF